ncbi:hypothetical protein BYT27DRAFT_7193761 [Phlegmacium glaucopus]|nr:hypothetical protein BYT27DRAFT_7193761 [Phlegmacium glaucopus]
MVVVSFIHGVEEFFLTGLISLAIVFATIRAYLAKLLASMETAGFSPLFILYLGILSLCGCIAIIRYCAWFQQVDDDEECGITEEDITPNSRLKSPVLPCWRWDGQSLRFYEGRRGAIKLVDEPSVAPMRGRW